MVFPFNRLNQTPCKKLNSGLSNVHSNKWLIYKKMDNNINDMSIDIITYQCLYYFFKTIVSRMYFSLEIFNLMHKHLHNLINKRIEDSKIH